jgi:hypothetical protein
MSILYRLKLAVAIIRGKEEQYPAKFCVLSPDGLKLLRKTRIQELDLKR